MLRDDVRGRSIVQSMWSELEKIADATTDIATYGVKGAAGALLARKGIGPALKAGGSSSSTTAISAALNKSKKLLKVGEDRSKLDRAAQALPAAGALVGGAWGFKDPRAFTPSSLFKGLKGKERSTKGRMASALLGAGLGATTAWLPSTAIEARKAMKKEAQGENQEESPVAKILGADIETLNDRVSHGVPIVQSPPGFVYEPQLRAFIPNQADSGWMSQDEATQARQNAGSYQSGVMDNQALVAQDEADRQATASLQQEQREQQQQQQQQQQQAQQPGAAAQGGVAGAGQAAPPAVPSPQAITGQAGGETLMQPKVKSPKARSDKTVAR